MKMLTLKESRCTLCLHPRAFHFHDEAGSYCAMCMWENAEKQVKTGPLAPYPQQGLERHKFHRPSIEFTCRGCDSTLGECHRKYCLIGGGTGYVVESSDVGVIVE